ncbi:halocarboxylic acid dehydrogenase DehI family protein [Paraliobacillus zengyii]|uniref:halocarboxylic acid dehydrogenase DehI family protein n=1 Tax=Paraliobacillus zengyii TaxID=2213194 RepID=UPI000DD36E0E|nr:halocarboxylic acid dehydrogenase DehI family protein [Paraliobacillus zengyii]
MNQYGIPEVFEADAHGIVKEVYQDIKYVLKVPIVNFLFRALANYPEFLVHAWQQVRPNMLSLNMESMANDLRFPLLNKSIPTYDLKKDYSSSTLSHINYVVATFQYVNPKLLLIASAWMESLAERPIVSQKVVKGIIQPGFFNMPPIEMIKVETAPLYVKQLLLEVAKEHASFDVASDYRALACYPRFFEMMWRDLKPYISSNEYTLLRSNLLNQAIKRVREEMPYPITLNSHQLEHIYEPAQIAGIMGIVSYFHRFLPGLIIENEFIRRYLLGES